MIAEGNRSAVLYGPRDLRIESRPIAEPGTGEVVIEIAAVGVCGSDVHYYEHGRVGSRVVRDPLVLGHEACGHIVALGPGVTGHEIGDRVVLEPGVPCRHCRECRAGRYNLCRDVRFLGSPPVNGAMTNYLVADADLTYGLPPNISAEAGALIEPLAVAVWACRKADVGAGASVLITGAGPIGLLTAQVARASGAAEIVVTDINDARLANAARMGSIRVLDARTAAVRDEELEVDALIECSGSSRALADALPALAPAGRAVMVGMGADEVTLPVDLIQRRELWVTGTFRYANVYPTVIALAAAGRIDLETMISARYGLQDADAALRASRDDAESVKVLIIPTTSSSGGDEPWTRARATPPAR
jgi:L-iditol 2-dehydrogenase